MPSAFFYVTAALFGLFLVLFKTCPLCHGAYTYTKKLRCNISDYSVVISPLFPDRLITLTLMKQGFDLDEPISNHYDFGGNCTVFTQKITFRCSCHRGYTLRFRCL